MAKLAILAEKNEYDDNFLNVVGNAFKFDHAKGQAEWMKNSADAYATTAKAQDAEQFVILRYHIANPKKYSVFECVDFVGMTSKDIDKALKIWGKPDAAKKGTDLKTFGGHGNGGKFYMRQMFRRSRFITYRGGLLNVFGFDEKKRYGFAKEGGKILKDVKMSLREALKFAGIDDLDIPAAVKARWKRQPEGFTVARGEEPEKFSGRSTIGSVIERLRVHPQARRLVAHKHVVVVKRGESSGSRLELPKITAMAGFEKDRVIEMPRKFAHNGQEFSFRNAKHPDARLILRTSDQPFTRGSDLAALNGVDILGEIGCIGSYHMNELGFLRFAQEADFIYGECECPLLEDEDFNCVSNDREKLVDNELSRAALAWIAEQVDKLAEEMSGKRKREQVERDLRQSSLFIALLDRWKNKFMIKLTGLLFGGTGIGDTFGGSGGGGDGSVPRGDGKGGKGEGQGSKQGEGEGGGGSGIEQRKGPKVPRVLLSGHDRDPLDAAASGPFILSERHPPVYQRDVDIPEGIYWINTSKPLADRILKSSKDGASSIRWREYLFQRFVDIILKQQIHEFGKRNPAMTADDIDQLMDKVTSQVHDAAVVDLERLLFEESMTGAAAGATATTEPATTESDA